jgi:hypothetical protein
MILAEESFEIAARDLFGRAISEEEGRGWLQYSASHLTLTQVVGVGDRPT